MHRPRRGTWKDKSGSVKWEMIGFTGSAMLYYILRYIQNHTEIHHQHSWLYFLASDAKTFLATFFLFGCDHRACGNFLLQNVTIGKHTEIRKSNHSVPQLEPFICFLSFSCLYNSHTYQQIDTSRTRESMCSSGFNLEVSFARTHAQINANHSFYSVAKKASICL